MLSASETPPSLTNRRFSEFLEILRSRGLDERAELYEAAVSVECFLNGIDNPMDLTVNEAIRVFSARPDPAGWDNTYWGKAAP